MGVVDRMGLFRARAWARAADANLSDLTNHQESADHGVVKTGLKYPSDLSSNLAGCGVIGSELNPPSPVPSPER